MSLQTVQKKASELKVDDLILYHGAELPVTKIEKIDIAKHLIIVTFGVYGESALFKDQVLHVASK